MKNSVTPGAQFTPGPWEWRGYYLQEVGYDNPYATPNGGPIWDDGSAGGEYSGFDTDSPNAHLIAAAPDLYEACQVVKDYLVALESAADGMFSDDEFSVKARQITEIRRRYHAPLHAALDSAMSKANPALPPSAAKKEKGGSNA